jgi:hypothetical protein
MTANTATAVTAASLSKRGTQKCHLTSKFDSLIRTPRAAGTFGSQPGLSITAAVHFGKAFFGFFQNVVL